MCSLVCLLTNFQSVLEDSIVVPSFVFVWTISSPANRMKTSMLDGSEVICAVRMTLLSSRANKMPFNSPTLKRESQPTNQD